MVTEIRESQAVKSIRNYCFKLGVSPNASGEEIERAYKEQINSEGMRLRNLPLLVEEKENLLSRYIRDLKRAKNTMINSLKAKCTECNQFGFETLTEIVDRNGGRVCFGYCLYIYNLRKSATEAILQQWIQKHITVEEIWNAGELFFNYSNLFDGSDGLGCECFDEINNDPKINPEACFPHHLSKCLNTKEEIEHFRDEMILIIQKVMQNRLRISTISRPRIDLSNQNYSSPVPQQSSILSSPSALAERIPILNHNQIQTHQPGRGASGSFNQPCSRSSQSQNPYAVGTLSEARVTTEPLDFATRSRLVIGEISGQRILEGNTLAAASTDSESPSLNPRREITNVRNIEVKGVLDRGEKNPLVTKNDTAPETLINRYFAEGENKKNPSPAPINSSQKSLGFNSGDEELSRKKQQIVKEIQNKLAKNSDLKKSLNSLKWRQEIAQINKIEILNNYRDNLLTEQLNPDTSANNNQNLSLKIGLTSIITLAVIIFYSIINHRRSKREAYKKYKQ